MALRRSKPVPTELVPAVTYYWATSDGTLRSSTVKPRNVRLLDEAEYNSRMDAARQAFLGTMEQAGQLARETRQQRLTVLTSRTGMSVDELTDLGLV